MKIKFLTAAELTQAARTVDLGAGRCGHMGHPQGGILARM